MPWRELRGQVLSIISLLNGSPLPLEKTTDDQVAEMDTNMGARSEKVAKPRKSGGDMGQGSFEEAFSNRGASRSKQGPKKVLVEKHRT